MASTDVELSRPGPDLLSWEVGMTKGKEAALQDGRPPLLIGDSVVV